MTTSELMEAMSAAGAPFEAILIAIRALEEKDAEIRARDDAAAQKRAADAERKRRERAASTDSPRTVQAASAPPPLDDIYSNPPPPSETKVSSGGKRKRAPVDFQIPDWVPVEPWEAFVAMRRKMRNVPFTETAAKGIVEDLDRLRAEGHDPAKLLLKAVKRGWRAPFGDDDTRVTATAAKRPMNVDELRNAIRFAEDHGDHERAAECKAQLQRLRSEARPPPPQIQNILSKTAAGLRASNG